MFNPKSTIYQTGWLDLVFANRNKSYGAYELRQNYNQRLVFSLFIASFLMVSVVSFPLIKQKYFTEKIGKPVEKEPIVTVVELKQLEQKKLIVPQTSTPPSSAVRVPTTRFFTLKAVSTPVTEDPPVISTLANTAVGPQNVEGPITTGLDNIIDIPSGGNGHGLDMPADNGNSLVSVELLEKTPEFPGGMAAFANFLRKNLRYPEQAREAGVSGRVFISFVVEKDGRLTDIKVLKGIGFGCDQEATRVLKKSPLWNPGVQNKREVRVLYTIPLVFTLGEE